MGELNHQTTFFILLETIICSFCTNKQRESVYGLGLVSIYDRVGLDSNVYVLDQTSIYIKQPNLIQTIHSL